ncbi:unnamed protein product, partial [Mesorhabditis belari]|uniref:Degenerin mec-4/10 cytosolic domain-containing protein n=1 Tax=Mesorhabditis belari TaxID=2138241 RepID=A0AAF3EVC0_9BILA
MSWVNNLKNWERLHESQEYMKKVYGDPQAYMKFEDQKFVTEREFYGETKYGECFNSTDSSAQCEIIQGEFDPRQLPYDQRMKWHFREFCYKTSAHGIPMIGQAPNPYYRAVWVCLFSACMVMLFINARSVMEKYERNEKIVDIALKFDTAPFPAITICNLNPYKAHLASNVELVRRMLNAYNGAMSSAANKDQEAKEQQQDEESERSKRAAITHEDLKKKWKTLDKYRMQRANLHLFEVGLSRCNCDESEEEDEKNKDNADEYEDEDALGITLPPGKKINECKERKYEEPEGDDDRCLCAFDRNTEDAWPCFKIPDWTDEQCASCTADAICQKNSTTKVRKRLPCKCNPLGQCVAYDKTATLLHIWQYLAGAPPTEDPNFIKAMGFEGMKDEVAIVTKAKENIIFVMAALPMDEREKLSTSKKELIQKCSFNGEACSVEEDFLTVVDPNFGNCFTYNYERNDSKTSIRAGPMYGLRMLVYINASDYLPTTEATGVRITIHEKEDFPFPDTFGYSAPTGYISSFGLRMRKMSRLPAPYGDCTPDGKTSAYIYQEYQYSVEGCYRTCFQNLVLDECGCGDPRFPVPNGTHCEALNPVQRECLDRKVGALQELHGSFKCRCQQPCAQSIYTVTYSPAKWPSQSLSLQLGSCNGTALECNKHYKENAAMIEVFYEQLNYEMLTESEAYGLVNLLADFGGQLDPDII